MRKNGINTEENIIFLDLTMGVGIINFYKNEINESVIGEIGHTTVKGWSLCFVAIEGAWKLCALWIQ